MNNTEIYEIMSAKVQIWWTFSYTAPFYISRYSNFAGHVRYFRKCLEDKNWIKVMQGSATRKDM